MFGRLLSCSNTGSKLTRVKGENAQLFAVECQQTTSAAVLNIPLDESGLVLQSKNIHLLL